MIWFPIENYVNHLETYVIPKKTQELKNYLIALKRKTWYPNDTYKQNELL